MAFRHLFADELRRNLRSPWLLVVLIMLSVGGWSAIRLGQRDWGEQRDTFVELVQGRVQAQVTFPAATGRAAEPGLRVVRPPNLGVVFLQGYDRSLPSAWEFAPAGSEALSSFAATSRLPGGGSWDLEILTRVVGGLLAIGLGLWNSLSDRRTGWLDVLRGFPLSPHAVSMARLVAGAGTLFVVVVIWWSVMSIAVWWHGPGSSLLPRLWSLAPVSWASLVSVFGLATVCAYLIRNEFLSIVTCVALWTGVGVLGPTAIALAAEFALPTAPQARMERERRQQYDDALQGTKDAVAKQLGDRIPLALPPLQQADVADREFPSLDAEWQRGLLTARREALELEADWQQQRREQQRLVTTLSWLSPGTLSRDVLAEIGGTGLGENRAWETAIRDHSTRLNDALFDNRPVVNLNVPLGKGGAAMMFRRYPSPRYATLPQFEQPARSWRVRVVSAAAPLVGLLVWCVGTLVGAHLATVRTMRMS